MLKQQQTTTLQALDGMAALLSGINHSQRSSIPHAERLELMRRARRFAERAQALAATLTAEVERNQSSMAVAGTSLTSFIAVDEHRDSRDAARAVFEARDLARHPNVGRAALGGKVSTGHARGIAKGMAQLPPGLDAAQRSRAEDAFLRLAENLRPDQIPDQTVQVLGEVAPELVPDERDEQRRLERQRHQALRRRSFRHGDDGEGSIWFSGKLPHLEAEPFIRILQAHVASNRRQARDNAKALRALRPGPRVLREHGGSGEDLTTQQRWADALVGMVREHRGAPQSMGESPRIVITMQEEKLTQRAEQSGVLPGGARIPAGELRRLMCDAALMPVVLGGESEILDVGREHRLVTPGMRRTLSLRDKGCVFPGCQKPDAECEAHHVIPWWDQGRTELGNLALLCPHHHAMIEPDRFNPRSDQWRITFNPRTRLPIVHPPARFRSHTIIRQ